MRNHSIDPTRAQLLHQQVVSRKIVVVWWEWVLVEIVVLVVSIVVVGVVGVVVVFGVIFLLVPRRQEVWRDEEWV